MKNRKFLKEAVNEIQLDDLYSKASKVEQEIISLAEMAVKFSNSNVKKQALALKGQANSFTTLLSGIITGEDEQQEIQNVEVEENQREVIESNEQTIDNTTSFLTETFESLFENEIEEINNEKVEEETEEVVEEETTETDTLDLSTFFNEVINELSFDSYSLVTGKLSEILTDTDADLFSEEIETLKDVEDVETLNSVLEDIYDKADEYDIDIKL